MRWTRIDLTMLENPPGRLEASDQCFYAREYASGKSYSHSDTNQLIMNFKKPVSARDTPAWKYKLKAIEQFATEAVSLLTKITFKFYLSHLPSSKCLTDPAYDRRLEDVISAILPHCPNATRAAPIQRISSVAPAHSSVGSRPTIAQVQSSLRWCGLPDDSKPIVFLDDVLTTGTTYKACQNLVRLSANSYDPIGVFWARTVWDKTASDEIEF